MGGALWCPRDNKNYGKNRQKCTYDRWWVDRRPGLPGTVVVVMWIAPAWD